MFYLMFDCRNLTMTWLKFWNSRNATFFMRTRPKASWWSLDIVWICLICCRKIIRLSRSMNKVGFIRHGTSLTYSLIILISYSVHNYMVFLSCATDSTHRSAWFASETSGGILWLVVIIFSASNVFCSRISAYHEWVSYRMGVSKLQAIGMFMKSLAVHSASHQVSC